MGVVSQSLSPVLCHHFFLVYTHKRFYLLFCDLSGGVLETTASRQYPSWICEERKDTRNTMFRILAGRSVSSGVRTTFLTRRVGGALHSATATTAVDGTDEFRSSSHRRYLSSYHHNDDDEDEDGSPRTALVVGSSGSLGRTLCRYLSKELKVQVVGADVVPPHADDEANFSAGGFIPLPLPPAASDDEDTLPGTPSLSELTVALVDGLSQVLVGDQELNAIVSVAGAWEGDPPLPPSHADDMDKVEGARQYAMTIDRMLGMNLYPLLAAGYASHHFMTDRDGLFVAIGATAALSATPGMLGYGLSKAATHHFVHTLGEMTGKAVTTKSRRREARRLRHESPAGESMVYLQRMSVIGILPTTIDTPMNRMAMPQADFGEWTKPVDIAKEIGMWMERPAIRPHSGSLVKVYPNANGVGATFQLVR